MIKVDMSVDLQGRQVAEYGFRHQW